MPSLDEFAANVARSGLVPAEALDRALEALAAGGGVGAEGDAAGRLAQGLIAAGALTAYQARKLLAGVTKGFFLGGCRVLRPLGEGGTSLVFLAAQADGREVAVKVLPPSRAAEEARALDRFKREVDLSQRVRHPNVARTLGVGTADGVNFMIMEYVPGESLYHAVKARGPLGVVEAARFFVKVLDGLDAAHAAGLIHRDIKPTNLMMTPDGEAKVLDLGLARALGEDSLPRPEGVVVGTLDYISPEQIDDPSAADRRSDLYSLGCTLYFALAGRPPFEGGDLVNKIYKQRFEEPEPLARVNPAVPAGLAAVVRKLMAKPPDDRHQTARALRADLVRYADPARPADDPAPDDPSTSDADVAAEFLAEGSPEAPAEWDPLPRAHAVRKRQQETQRLIRIAVILAVLASLAALAVALFT